MAVPLNQLVSQVMALMGRNNPPGLIRERITLTVQCLRDWFFVEDPATLKSYLDGFDLKDPVERLDLIPTVHPNPPRLLVSYRYSPEAKYLDGAKPSRFGMYYAEPGTSKHTVGINTKDRRYLRYQLIARTPALRSRAATGFVNGFGLIQGGSIQYTIPNADRSLRIVHIQHAIRSS